MTRTMRRRTAAWALACCAAFASTLAGAQNGAPPAAPAGAANDPAGPVRGAPPDQIAQMQREIAAVLVREQIPGAAVALVNADGVLWVGGFGYADAPNGKQATPGTPFAAPALSPLMVGLLAARYAGLNSAPLKEGGPPRAVLDEPLDPKPLGLDNPFQAQHPLTMGALLEQTAGLEDLAPLELLHSGELDPLLAQVLSLRAHPSRWPPGERFSPSRVGFTAAAAQLERWTRRPFFAIADAELFRPLDLKASTFRPDPAALDALSPGHREGRALPWRPAVHWPALGLVTSAQDLAALLRTLVSGGLAASGPAQGKPLFATADFARLVQGRSLGLAQVAAAGLGTRADESQGHRRVSQGGAFDGNASVLAFFPDEKAGYAVLLNSESPEGLEAIAAAAQRVLLRPRVQSATNVASAPGRAQSGSAAIPAQPASLAADDAKAVRGVWRKLSVRLEALRLFDELLGFAQVRASPGDASILRFSSSFSSSQPIFPLGNGLFSTDPGGPATFARVHSASGEETLVTPGATYVRSSALAAFGRLGLLLAALLALCSSLLFALIWVPRATFGALRNSPELALRGLPALSALVLFYLGALLVFSRAPLGSRNLTTLLVCGLTTLYPALAFASLLESIRAQLAVRRAAMQGQPGAFRSRGAQLARAHALACSLLACWLALELAVHGLVALRTWAL